MKTKTKKRIGAQIVESLQEFLAELQNGADLSTFKCRVVEVKPPSKPADAELVKQTRAALRASQTIFARFLGVSAQTVRAWEQGENVPSDIAKR